MEFGYYIRPASTFEGMVEMSRHAEQLGFQGVYLNDHVHGMREQGMEPYLESWTALSGIGALTSKIKLGHVVLFNSLRNPAFLAKSVATLDRMTGGRFELLIGAGWNEPEYTGYDLMERGRGMPSPRERVDRFKEALQILRGMLDNEVFSYRGKYWKLDKAINKPPPIQKNMRISVGGTKPRMIRITAKYADGLNIGGGLTSIKHAVDGLDSELEKNGKRLEDFYVSVFASQATLNDNLEEYQSMAKRIAERSKRQPQAVMEDIIAGTPEVLVEKMRRAQDLGVKLMIVYVRPARTIGEMKEKLSAFNDLVVDKI
jgi:alkanesulfonate monooxygenase SsuD/methylene tetrahydromethanopterin reductase-like flavin-dependent oxidoreductase (luciferase family)